VTHPNPTRLLSPLFAFDCKYLPIDGVTASSPTTRRPLDDLVDLTKLSRRTICYLLKVWPAFSDVGPPRDRLARTGWTKLAVIADNSEPEEMDEALSPRRHLHRERAPRAAEGRNAKG
jgi:hypothetical protein